LTFANGGGLQLATALVGGAGLGKTTLLQALAVALAGPGAVRELMPLPEGWVRQGEPYGQIEADLMLTEGDASSPKWPKKTAPYRARYLVSGDDPEGLPAAWLADPAIPTVPSIVEWTGDGPRKDRQTAVEDMSRLKRTAYAEGKPGWFACGYGPFQNLRCSSPQASHIQASGRKSARFITLFRRDAALAGAGDWLVSLHNSAREGDEASRRTLDIAGAACANGLLPTPGALMVNARQAALLFDGLAPMNFNDLDPHARTLLALGLDLIRGLTAAFPQARNPLEQRGVVLIDDLDACFEAGRQREVGLWLRHNFPRLQVIASTHRPFLAHPANPWVNVLLEPAGATHQSLNGKSPRTEAEVALSQPAADYALPLPAPRVLEGLAVANGNRPAAVASRVVCALS
jgi:hypothetical protein